MRVCKRGRNPRTNDWGCQWRWMRRRRSAILNPDVTVRLNWYVERDIYRDGGCAFVCSAYLTLKTDGIVTLIGFLKWRRRFVSQLIAISYRLNKGSPYISRPTKPRPVFNFGPASTLFLFFFSFLLVYTPKQV